MSDPSRLTACESCGQHAYSPNSNAALCRRCTVEFTTETPYEAIVLFKPAPAPIPKQLVLPADTA